mmetsp:Transcript_31708/g.70492  ORF Transcript_31708/g.70492 Transcript_31708/m.70492 type:complete len:340 (+) Transcript_31708:293-1312(+)
MTLQEKNDQDESKPFLLDTKGEPAASQQGLVSPSMKVPVFIGYYALASSTLLLLNKISVHLLPAPTFILFCQFFVSAAGVKLGQTAGWLEAEPLQWDKVKKFLPVAGTILVTIYSNMKVLQHSNVETFITFRSSTPLVLSILDYWFLGRELPNAKSWGCLVVLFMASIGYVLVDSSFNVMGYSWLAVWYGFFVFDQVYVKYVCDTTVMSNWSRVYYTNVLAAIPVAVLMPVLPETKQVYEGMTDVATIIIIALSSIGGLAMSHSAYVLRDSVSATSFTVVGIVCKLLTVVLNCFIWDKHAGPLGLTFLTISILAGTFYKQAPKRQVTAPHHPEAQVVKA